MARSGFFKISAAIVFLSMPSAGQSFETQAAGSMPPFEALIKSATCLEWARERTLKLWKKEVSTRRTPAEGWSHNMYLMARRMDAFDRFEDVHLRPWVDEASQTEMVATFGATVPRNACLAMLQTSFINSALELEASGR